MGTAHDAKLNTNQLSKYHENKFNKIVCIILCVMRVSMYVSPLYLLLLRPPRAPSRRIHHQQHDHSTYHKQTPVY